ncbi:MAG TPA: transketolase [Ilumatobacter sp.]|nr:transketolase [Ilumatobacter sp.]
MSAATPEQLATAVRFLAADMVEAAGSGHPGLPLGMADVATVLFTEHLRFDAADPEWFDRDRFVLSAGHGSALLYALAWLCGYAGVELDHLRRFRQLGSPAAGHPEHGHFPGVETTTGPLGQGLATAVGMAIGEANLRATYGTELCDHQTYVLAGDGCLMEGVSQEAISLAGHLRLDRLTVLWDDNQISIDGTTALSTSDDQLARFAASGWATERVDGHDHAAVGAALTAARNAGRPSLIACRTTIGRGAPTKAGSHHVHGAPLGAEERAAMAAALGWPCPPFEVPTELLDAWRAAGRRGRAERAAWEQRSAGTGLADRLAAPVDGAAHDALAEAHRAARSDTAPRASRVSSQRTLDVLVPAMPALIGGSADLSGSNGTLVAAHRAFTAGDRTGDYVHYGVREHAMAAALNGLALHGGFVAYGGTFLVFSDYSRPAIRLAALMGLPVVHVLTHDSIGLGEDGPTHQPVEHLDALRAIPNLLVVRPADAVETVEAWQVALAQTDRPVALVLSRQPLPPLPHDRDAADGPTIGRGAYAVRAAAGADVTLLGSGSEVAVALAAADLLEADGVRATVISVPCLELLAAQPPGWFDELAGAAPRVAVEAATGQAWGAVLRPGDRFVGMPGFGRSAPAADLYEHFGITPAAIRAAALDAIATTTTTAATSQRGA